MSGGGMMRVAGVAALLLAGPAAAQEAGQYGGGFIEFLMTGRDPGAVARPLRASPVAADGTMLARPAPRSGDWVGRADEADPLAVPRPPAAPRVAAQPQEPAAPALAMDPRYARQTVPYEGRHGAGTIVIDTPSRFLYLVQGNGQALRYGIGVGRPGFTWSGVKTVSQKREWPGWTPPPEMLRRRPDLPTHMAGGPANPLGARALYLGSSLYRIHGTNEPHTIGQNVSSGCIRMMNQDVIDLYDRVPVGARVVVI
ncbi:L,D-transpeptidase [Methylobacterium oryzihabitans]|nr:L,D-transpeptidase [Methylobacterium oryzihabitans]